MLQARDWLSFLVGVILGAFGFLPFLNSIGKGPEWFALAWLPIEILAYVVAAGGFYLVINSVIEMTNSNPIGWVSFIIAGLITATGILKVLGLFLIIATFAMEL